VLYTYKILLASVLSRALLQVTFFTMIGRTTAGRLGQTYAFVGALMLVAVIPPIVQAPDVIIEDKWQRTLYQLRLGNLPILQIMLLRSWIYGVQGLLTSLATVVVLGPLFLGVPATVQVVRVWPAFLAVSVSSLGLGMFIGVASLGKRGDVLLANGAQYLVMLASGAVAPVSRYPVLQMVGQALPGYHILAFVRGRSWHSCGMNLVWELVLGIVWLSLAQALLAIQSKRVRAGGFDDYA
jgi:ABC-2 type transport system permease protein